MRIIHCIVIAAGFSVTSLAEEKAVSPRVDAVERAIFEKGQMPEEKLKDSTANIPQDLSNTELFELAKAIKLSDWELETYGDQGITYIETAFSHCLYELAKRENGEHELIQLLKDRSLKWDAGHSLILWDAIVKKGKPCLPLLRDVPKDIPHVQRHIELIEKGINSAI